jgi:hypothetical protein
MAAFAALLRNHAGVNLQQEVVEALFVFAVAAGDQRAAIGERRTGSFLRERQQFPPALACHLVESLGNFGTMTATPRMA